LAAARNTDLHAYIVVSLLTGARTEELRALTWAHVSTRTTPPFIEVWHSVRAKGETKTRKSRRTLKLPQRYVELRHSFVSLLSDGGMPVEQIARLVGHSSTTTTELVYRHQIRPVVQGGAEVMDRLFPGESPDA
jgi:integrase